LLGEIEGQHSIGFKSLWLADRSRSFANDEYSQDARPMVAFVWYPAASGTPETLPDRDDSAMTFGEYLEHLSPPTDQQELRNFAQASRDYTISSFRLDSIDPLVGEDLDAADSLQHQARSASFLATDHAAPLPGSYPLIIYHPGLGGNILENVGLCEYLASRGYIVISSTFFYQASWQDRFYCGEISTSLQDIRFLLNQVAQRIPFADTNRVGLAGHSFGAQLALIYACQPDNTIDAVVALDSTIDYQSVEKIQSPIYRDTSWNDVLKALTTGYGSCRSAILNVSGTMPDGQTQPDYAVVRRLFNTRLFFGTVNYAIDHESFLSQTILARSLISTDSNQRSTVEWDRDKRTYNAVLEMTGQFFDQELKETGEMMQMNHDEISLAFQPPIEQASGTEALSLYKNDGLEAIKSLYRSMQLISPYARINLNPTLEYLTDRADHAAIIELLEFALAFESNRGNWRWELRLAEMYLVTNDTDNAVSHYNKALEFCDDPAASSMIRNELNRLPRAEDDEP